MSRHAGPRQPSIAPGVFRLVQPWGPDLRWQYTAVGAHRRVSDAFAHLDSLAERMLATGAPSDAIELVVIDDRCIRVGRPSAH